MNSDKNSTEEFEKNYKDKIFSRTSELITNQSEIISKMKISATNLGQTQVDIPNASITLNNKLVELLHIFEKAGISMFSKKIEEIDVVSSSFIGDAIIQDLIRKLEQATQKLEKYGKTMGDISKKRNERLLALQNISRIRKLISRIRELFIPVQHLESSLTEEERNALDRALQEYKDIDSEIWNYNLEDNIVQALVEKIAGPQRIGDFAIRHQYSESSAHKLLEDIIPDLKQLGLEHLIPKLREALDEAYKWENEVGGSSLINTNPDIMNDR